MGKKNNLSVEKVGKKTHSKKSSKINNKQFTLKFNNSPLHRLKSKNISSKVSNGVIVQTRDEYFAGKKNYKKNGYENKGNYRKSVVVDSNRKDELALIKLISTSHKGHKTNNNKSKFRPFIETLDDEYKPIKLSSKFIKTKKRLSKNDVDNIKIISLKHAGLESVNNKNKLRNLKNRK